MKEFLKNQLKHILLWAPIFISFGVALYFTLSFEPNLWTVIMGLGIGIATLFCTKRFPALGLVSCFLVGFGYAGIYSHIKKVPYIQHDIHGIEITGTVTNLDYTNDKLRIYLDTKNYGRVRVSTPTDNNYNIGDVISGTGGLFKPKPADIPNGFDFARWAYFNNISASGYINDTKTLYTTESAVYNMRNQIKNIANSFLADSLVLGYKNTLPPDHREIWATNGVAHLWSISGYHTTLVMTWLFIVFYFLFRLFPRLVRRVPARIPALICSWLGLLGYVLISGSSVATLRAFLMTSLVMLAFVFGRNVLSLRAVCIAFLVLVAINPYFVMQAGFQLSFAAAFGILWFWTIVKPNMPANKVLKYVFATLLTATVASIFTAPFIMMHFGTFPIYGILGNLIFLPVFSFILMPLVVIGTLVALIGIHSPLALANRLYDFLLQIAKHIAGIPISEINTGSISTPAIIFIILGLACTVFIVNSEKFKYIVFRHLDIVFGATFISIGIIIATATPKPIFYISNNHKLIGAVIDGKLHFNKTKDSSNYFAFNTWKQFNGEDTNTSNLRLAKESGVYTVSFPKFSVSYIQNFVPLSNNISELCDDKDVKYIISYFDIKTNSTCANKIIHGGGVIYNSGKFISIPDTRLWHNRPE